MLGKLIAHAATRGEAIAQLAGALDRLQILGLPTNRRFLAACLRHRTFEAGEALIPFLAEHGDALRTQIAGEEKDVAVDYALATLFPSMGRAQLPCPFPRPVRLRHRGGLLELQVRHLGHALEVGQGGGTRLVSLPRASSVRLPNGAWHVQRGAVDLIIEDASFEPAASASGAAAANELRAPFNGKVIAVKAQPGATVVRGDTLLVLESMKLEHALGASRDGVIKSVHVEAGQQAATSQVLVIFEALQ
jgi:geranyl-CoA carboxylase alpha subunit